MVSKSIYLSTYTDLATRGKTDASGQASKWQHIRGGEGGKRVGEYERLRKGMIE